MPRYSFPGFSRAQPDWGLAAKPGISSSVGQGPPITSDDVWLPSLTEELKPRGVRRADEYCRVNRKIVIFLFQQRLLWSESGDPGAIARPPILGGGSNFRREGVARVIPPVVPWQPDQRAMAQVDSLIQAYRSRVIATLEPLVRAYYPDLLDKPDNEYRKMVELSTKMTLVGHACSEIAGYPFDARRQTIGSLFGACCFLADSFIDDFGEETTREYLERFELLLTEGWFDIRTDREKLFLVIISRLFAERDILYPTLRQAILSLYEAQKRDVELRLENEDFRRLPRRRQLALLSQCARDRSGHAIIVLSAFLVPEISLAYLNLIFAAGALIMHIDDHGDYYADLNDNRITYMNQVKDPVRALRSVFVAHIERLYHGLPANTGRALLIAFLTRYYLTRLEKRRQQKKQGASAWAVYE